MPSTSYIILVNNSLTQTIPLPLSSLPLSIYLLTFSLSALSEGVEDTVMRGEEEQFPSLSSEYSNDVAAEGKPWKQRNLNTRRKF